MINKIDGLLEKYNTIWDKVCAGIKKEFNSEPVYNKIFLKTKMGSNHTCLPVINLDSALNKLLSTSNFKSVNALKKSY